MAIGNFALATFFVVPGLACAMPIVLVLGALLPVLAVA